MITITITAPTGSGKHKIIEDIKKMFQDQGKSVAYSYNEVSRMTLNSRSENPDIQIIERDLAP